MGSSVPTCPKSAQQAFVLGLRRVRSCSLLLPRDPFQGSFLAFRGLAYSPSRGATMAMQSKKSSRPGQRRILDVPKDLLAEVLALLPLYLKAQAQTICWIFNNILSSPDMGQLLSVILQSTVIIPLLSGHPLAPMYASAQPLPLPCIEDRHLCRSLLLQPLATHCYLLHHVKPLLLLLLLLGLHCILHLLHLQNG